MKSKRALIIAVLMLMISLSACRDEGLKGTYKYQDNYYLVFSGNDKVEWHESSMVFEGTYKKTEDGYHFVIQGSGIIPTQEFDATIAEDGSLIINGRKYVKET